MRPYFALACLFSIIMVVAVGLLIRGPLERPDPCRHFYERVISLLDESARNVQSEPYYYGSAANMATIYLACRRKADSQ